jgi:hypothetical protein
MLGERAAQQAGAALVQDVCERAKANGCNLLETPRDKLTKYISVRAWVVGSRAMCVIDMCVIAAAAAALHAACCSAHTAVGCCVSAATCCCRLDQLPAGSTNHCTSQTAQGAFARAHEAALGVYEDPPASICYPCNGS